MRHTNREIQEAKMLGRRLSAFSEAPVPPITRARRAVGFVFAASWTLLRMSVRSVVMKMFDRTVCPKCDGHKNQLTHIVHDEFEMRPCKLCRAKGHVGWRERESWKWGGALKSYRLNNGLSLAQMYYAVGLVPEHVNQLEQGLIPLDDWPQTAINIADLQLDRDAAGHVSTT